MKIHELIVCFNFITIKNFAQIKAKHCNPVALLSRNDVILITEKTYKPHHHPLSQTYSHSHHFLWIRNHTFMVKLLPFLEWDNNYETVHKVKRENNYGTKWILSFVLCIGSVKMTSKCIRLIKNHALNFELDWKSKE